MSDPIHILIADDHPIVRQGLRQTLDQADGIEVVGETGDGEETLRAAARLKPAIILLDVDLPKMDGFQVADTLRNQGIGSKIIFLTVHREESFLQRALSLGASGYVLKDSAITDIISAVRAVSEEMPFISPAMTAYLLKKKKNSNEVGDLASLTPAERRVLRLIAQYKTTKEIAESLFVSPRTIESHRATITQKLGLHGSHSLMRYALQHLAEIEQD